ncbi:amino acid ABC transporter permease [uncultured Litoreibacter sp.]|uniref:amino acid ABC transporter permease n=1 Tax=uncultured Litoreibacter sp. TaxID=1392394 RepID=UPI00260A7F07|nr:amino acid ABC transporter permease [uncultured Litoreibacter sp.]
MTTSVVPPVPKRGFGYWLKKHFFSTWLNSVITVLFGALLIWMCVKLSNWAIFDAIWTVDNKEHCGHGAGACWAVIQDRGRLILFGLYPYEEQWRSTLACLIVILTIGLSCLPSLWSIKKLPTLWVIGFGAFVLLMRGGFAGLPLVTSEQWGGLSLTIFIFSAVFVLGMPLAVVFALARRSSLPVIAKGTGLFIDLVRSLPLLTILFAAAVVVPLLVPDWLEGNKLGRVVVAFAVFFAVYQAEIIRAGLQSTSQGQNEAAAALGMPYWSLVVDILLPQAFRNTLPSTINQAVITFKETSIVTIIGFFEVMASGNAAIGGGEWTEQFVEVYVFLALVYFVFVFGLSRYGAWLENRMRVGHA